MKPQRERQAGRKKQRDLQENTEGEKLRPRCRPTSHHPPALQGGLGSPAQQCWPGQSEERIPEPKAFLGVGFGVKSLQFRGKKASRQRGLRPPRHPSPTTFLFLGTLLWGTAQRTPSSSYSFFSFSSSSSSCCGFQFPYQHCSGTFLPRFRVCSPSSSLFQVPFPPPEPF